MRSKAARRTAAAAAAASTTCAVIALSGESEHQPHDEAPARISRNGRELSSGTGWAHWSDGVLRNSSVKCASSGAATSETAQ